MPIFKNEKLKLNKIILRKIETKKHHVLKDQKNIDISAVKYTVKCQRMKERDLLVGQARRFNIFATVHSYPIPLFFHYRVHTLKSI